MSFSKPTAAFDAAATAVHAYVAETLGHKAAAQLEVKLFDPATTNAVARDWQKAANTGHADLRDYIIYSNPVINRLDALACGRNPAPNGFEMGLWMAGELCALAYGGSVQQQLLEVEYIFAKPGTHPLKAHALSCTHAAASGFAKAQDALCVIYSGPLSPGSVKQIERGAIPLSLRERNNMWAGQNIIVPVNIADVPLVRQHAAGKSPLPPFVADDYEPAYRQLFGQMYSPF